MVGLVGIALHVVEVTKQRVQVDPDSRRTETRGDGKNHQGESRSGKQPGDEYARQASEPRQRHHDERHGSNHAEVTLQHHQCQYHEADRTEQPEQIGIGHSSADLFSQQLRTPQCQRDLRDF